jgi:hypothetical protein
MDEDEMDTTATRVTVTVTMRLSYFGEHRRTSIQDAAASGYRRAEIQARKMAGAEDNVEVLDMGLVQVVHDVKRRN